MNRLRSRRPGSAALPAALLGLLLLLGGCAVNQTAEVAAWRSVLNQGAGLPADTAANATLASGEALSLRRSLELAVRNNEQLALAGEDYLQALIAKDRSYSAFLPTLAFAPSYLREERSRFGEETVPHKALDTPLTGAVRVNPVRDISASRAAGASAEQGRARLLDGEAVVLLDVTKTFYQILAAERRTAVLEHSVAVQERRVADTGTQVRAGAARPVDLSQARAQLAQTRVSLEQARTDAANGRSLLAVLLGVPVVDGPLENDLTPPQAAWTPDDLLPLAEQRRQDLQAARSGVLAASRGLESAWGEYFPSVHLNVTRFLSRETFPDDVRWSGLLGVDLPIFNAGIAHQDVRAAYSRLRQAHTALAQARRVVLRDLRVSLEDLGSDERQLAELDQEVQAAREAMDQAEAAFKAGVLTGLDRLMAQDRLLAAELDQTRAAYGRDVDYLRLLRAAGVLDATLKTDLSGAARKAAAASGTDGGQAAGAASAQAGNRP